MKSIIKFFTISFFLAMFVSCNKEDKDPRTIRLVRRIDIYQSSSGSIDSNRTLQFRYDEQNRITEIISVDEYGKSESGFFSYPAESIMLDGSNTYTLNSDGFVTSMTEGEQLKQIWTYDVNGYLQKTEYYSELVSIPTTKSQILTWENGNIKTELDEFTVFTDPPSVISARSAYEYGSLPNKLASMDFGRHYVGVPRGLYGKSTLNLPAKTMLTRYDGLEDLVAIRYEIDREGYPVRIFVKESGYDEELRVVIEYED